MTTQAKLGDSLLKSLITLREQKGSLRIEDIGAIMQNMASTLQGDASSPDSFIRNEIENIANSIAEAKGEITALAPLDDDSLHLTNASSQLDAIIKTTEEATGTILDAADEIQDVVGAMGSGSEAEIRIKAAAARIYEACNFQDLTGQRLTKVISALGQIDERITNLMELFGQDANNSKPAKEIKDKKPTRKDEHLLNGPQLPGAAPTQQEIDALFSDIK